MVALVVLAVFAGIVLFGLSTTLRGWKIARRWRAPKTSWGDLPPAAKAFFLICIVAGVAVGVLLAVTARRHAQ